LGGEAASASGTGFHPKAPSFPIFDLICDPSLLIVLYNEKEERESINPRHMKN